MKEFFSLFIKILLFFTVLSIGIAVLAGIAVWLEKIYPILGLVWILVCLAALGAAPKRWL